MPFRYEERAFDARLDSIYQDMVDRVAKYDPANDRAFKTRGRGPTELPRREREAED